MTGETTASPPSAPTQQVSCLSPGCRRFSASAGRHWRDPRAPLRPISTRVRGEFRPVLTRLGIIFHMLCPRLLSYTMASPKPSGRSQKMNVLGICWYDFCTGTGRTSIRASGEFTWHSYQKLNSLRTGP